MRSVILAAGALVLALNGCGLFSKDEVEPPAELVSIETTLEVVRRWNRDTGSGVGRFYLKLDPLVSHDGLYVVDNRGRVSAYATEDGRKLWAVSVDAKVTGGVGGGEGVLLVGTSEAEVIALRQDDGDELWRSRVSSEVMSISNVELDTVVARSADGKLHALDTITGEKRWQAGRRTPPLSLRGASAPLIRDGRVIAGFDNGKLAALSLTRGTFLWEATIAVPSGRSELERMVDIDGVIRVDGGVVFVATYQGRVAAVTLSDGRILWARDISSFAGLTVDSERVYVTDALSNVWAFDRRSGVSLWRQEKLLRRSATAPGVLGQYVVVGDYDGYLHWMSKFDGHFVSRLRAASHGLMAPPVIHAGRAFVLSKEGGLSAWELGDEQRPEDGAGADVQSRSAAETKWAGSVAP